jgi:hypothetical protein
VRDISHAYKTTGKIMVLYIVISYIFREEMENQKTLNRMGASIPHI